MRSSSLRRNRNPHRLLPVTNNTALFTTRERNVSTPGVRCRRPTLSRVSRDTHRRRDGVARLVTDVHFPKIPVPPGNPRSPLVFSLIPVSLVTFPVYQGSIYCETPFLL